MHFEGQITRIIFQSGDTGYTVASLLTEDGEITACGNLIGVQVGQMVDVEGELIFHPKYGEQISVQSMKTTTPTSIAAIYQYLSSGMIEKVGPAMAERIVDRFGDKTLEVMKNEPEKLLQVRGIGKKTLGVITASFNAQEASRETMLFLQELGLTPKMSHLIYQAYGDRARMVIENNPYQMTEDVKGIGFRKADEIAMAYNMEKEDPSRIQAGILFALQEAESGDGHSCLPEDLLIERTARLLEIPKEKIEDALFPMMAQLKLHAERMEEANYYYRHEVYEQEKEVAHRMTRLLFEDFEPMEVPEDFGDGLSDEQAEGVRMLLQSKAGIITGGPGTGKTTLLRSLLEVIREEHQKIALCAPTGRAAKRMEESTGMEASTIHRLLGYNPSEYPPFAYDEESPLDVDWVIVDESSMLDLELTGQLLRAIPPSARLVLIGDVDQLPSVGAGNVLEDFIQSEEIPTVRLQKVFRQAQESLIVMNAHRMQKGEDPVVNAMDKDFFFMETPSAFQSIGLIQSLMAKRLPEAYSAKPGTDIQILSPVKKQPFGTENLNIAMQETLNPKTPSKEEMELRGTIFREGDRVMQMKNNYDIALTLPSGEIREGVFNGDIGTIESVFDDGLTVRFDDGGFCRYQRKELDDLGLAYAITIHKSQGSEFPYVIIPLHKGPPMLYTRNLIYTAITRAKTMVILVGEKSVLTQMIGNVRTTKRYTHLAKRMREAADIGRKFS